MLKEIKRYCSSSVVESSHTVSFSVFVSAISKARHNKRKEKPFVIKPQKICRQKLCFNVWIRNNIKIWKKLLSVTPTPTLVAL